MAHGQKRAAGWHVSQCVVPDGAGVNVRGATQNTKTQTHEAPSTPVAGTLTAKNSDGCDSGGCDSGGYGPQRLREEEEKLRRKRQQREEDWSVRR